MERLVHIGLRHGDVVLEPAWDRLIKLVDHAQGRVAVLDGIHDDPHREQVVDLIQSLVLVHHLFINTEEMLRPAFYLGFNPCFFHVGLYFVHDLFYKSFPRVFAQGDLFRQVVIGFRFQIFQRKIVQFHFDLGNTQTVGDRRIDLHRLLGLFLLLGRRHILKGTHVVKAVGQFDQDHPDILCHSKEHLS